MHYKFWLVRGRLVVPECSKDPSEKKSLGCRSGHILIYTLMKQDCSPEVYPV